MKTKSCRLTTLFCFETNIYLRVCLTFVTFFYFNDRSEQFAKLLTQCHPLTESQERSVGSE